MRVLSILVLAIAGTVLLIACPASGEYVWEANSEFSLYFAKRNATTGALGSTTLSASPINDPTAYPSIAISPSGNHALAQNSDSV